MARLAPGHGAGAQKHEYTLRQTAARAIVGIGSVQKLSAVRWGVAGNIVWAWIFTIPCSAFISAVAWWFAQHFF